MKRLALAMALGGLMTGQALADTTIKWLHITSIPEELAMLQAAAREYEAGHPGIKIEDQFLENEAFKAKLTTLLQSDEAPDIFFQLGWRRAERAGRSRCSAPHRGRDQPRGHGVDRLGRGGCLYP